MISLTHKKIFEYIFVKFGLFWKIPLFLYLFHLISYIPIVNDTAYVKENAYIRNSAYFMWNFIAARYSDFSTLSTDNDSLLSSQITFTEMLFQNLFFLELLFEIAFIVLVVVFVFFLDRFTRKEVGISISLKSIFLFIGGCLLSSFIISLVFGILWQFKSIVVVNFYWEQYDVFSEKLQDIIMTNAILCFGIAFQEELFTRAYFILNLKWTKPIISILVSAIIFSLMHFYFDSSFFEKDKSIIILSFINLTFLGIIYGYYFYKIGDLWFLIGMHFAWNFTLSSVYGLNLGGEQSRGIFVTAFQGSPILSGGEFGPEGGIVVTIGLVLLMIIMYFILRKVPAVHRKQIA